MRGDGGPVVGASDARERRRSGRALLDLAADAPTGRWDQSHSLLICTPTRTSLHPRTVRAVAIRDWSVRG